MAAEPHVTIVPYPGLGHLIPLIEFAKRLVNLHNFHVSFLLIPDDTQSTFLRSTTFPNSIRFIHLPPIDISPFVDENTDSLTRNTLTIRESVPMIQSSIVSESQGGKTTLVVDFFATDAFEVTSKLSIKKYVFFSSTAALLAFMIYLPVLDREVEGEFVDLQEPVKVPGCKPIPVDDLVHPVMNRKVRYYTSFLDQARRFCTADGILVNSCPDLEPVSLKAFDDDLFYKDIHTPRVYPVGPLTKNVIGESSECTTWLDKQPAESVLFVAFGSKGFLSGEQITELAWGLELSGQRFIWVVRPPEEVQSSKDADPLKYLPEGFLDRIEGIGMVVPSWAPQEEILRHMATGGFLSHCGWNSTLESVVNGVPMITWPLFAEQRMNAAMLVDELGVAVRAVKATVEKEVVGEVIVGREDIEKVVKLLMEGEKGKNLRSRAKELRQRVLKAWEKGGSSYNSLSQVVEEWKRVNYI